MPNPWCQRSEWGCLWLQSDWSMQTSDVNAECLRWYVWKIRMILSPCKNSVCQVTPLLQISSHNPNMRLIYDVCNLLEHLDKEQYMICQCQHFQETMGDVCVDVGLSLGRVISRSSLKMAGEWVQSKFGMLRRGPLVAPDSIFWTHNSFISD